MANESSEIEVVVKIYLDGLHEGDADKLNVAFHPISALTWEQNGRLVVLTRDDWLQSVRSRPSAKSRGLSRHDQILQIDQASPTTAFVKLKCATPPQFYTDYLNLLKVEERWQIVQKIFSTEIHN